MRYQETSTTAPTASQLNPGEKVYVNFSAPVARTFNDGFNYVQVFIDANIADASASSINIIGDVQGELGNPRGFDLFTDEPTAPIQTRTPAETAVFPLAAQTGYSTRHSFFYNGAFPLNPGTLRVQVAFSKLATRTSGTYESMWGQPLTTDMSVSAVATQSVPTP
jgi:hypothetical protein